MTITICDAAINMLGLHTAITVVTSVDSSCGIAMQGRHNLSSALDTLMLNIALFLDIWLIRYSSHDKLLLDRT